MTRKVTTRRAPQLADVQHLTMDHACRGDDGTVVAVGIEVPCVPPSPNRELPHVRHRGQGESRWSVRRDWSDWAVLWMRMAMNRWGWAPAGRGDQARVLIWQARTKLLDPGNLEYSVKGAVDGLKVVARRKRVGGVRGRDGRTYGGIMVPVPGAGAIYEDDPGHLPNLGERRGFDVRQCKVAHYRDERMLILVDRRPHDAGDHPGPHWYRPAEVVGQQQRLTLL